MKDGLYFNGNISNYNFIQGDRWGGWTNPEPRAEMWLKWQGGKTTFTIGVWKDAAELKIPVEYLT